MSGMDLSRSFAASAMSLIRPALVKDIELPTEASVQARSPLASATKSCDWSLKCTKVIFAPMSDAKSAPPRCPGLPTYGVPKVRPSGWALAAAMSAGTLW